MEQSLNRSLIFRGGAVLQNRLCKTALSEGLSDASGDPNALMINLYRRWGEGGAGLLITGNAHVDRRYRERSTSLILDQKSDRRSYRALAAASRNSGAKIWLQLNHPGRQCPAYISNIPVAPMAISPPFRFSGYNKTRAIGLAELPELVDRFVVSAQIAADCGFDGVQIHSAHGYLLSSFLSPNLNRREDAYGDGPQGRALLLIEIISAIRTRLPEPFVIAVKINATDFERDGLGSSEATTTASLCVEAGADCIEVSGGSYRRMMIAGENEARRAGEAALVAGGYFRQFARNLTIRLQDVPIMLTGGVRSVDSMVQALDQEGIALIGLGRPMCVDVNIAKKLLSGEVTDLSVLAAPGAIGPGLLGAGSVMRRIRRLNAFAAQAWYGEQLRRAAHDLAPDEKIGAWRALRVMMARDHQSRMVTAP